MSPEIMRAVLELIESEVQRRPTPDDFELAYQVRVAIDRIKFAIKQTEEFGPPTDEMREVGFELLDALDRLESAERHFQKRFRCSPGVNGNRPESQLGNRRATSSGRTAHRLNGE